MVTTSLPTSSRGHYLPRGYPPPVDGHGWQLRDFGAAASLTMEQYSLALRVRALAHEGFIGFMCGALAHEECIGFRGEALAHEGFIGIGWRCCRQRD